MTSRSRVRVGGLPKILVPAALVGFVVIAGPLLALLASIPYSRIGELAGSREALVSLRLSVVTAAISTVICAVLGVPLSLWLRVLARRHPGVGGAVQLIVYAPLVLSPVVSGLALVFFWGRSSPIGGWLEQAGLPVAYTSVGVIVVQVFVSLPFFIATTVTSLQAVPVELEESAATEGASRMQVTARILIPLAWTGMLTGAVLSFARALSEYGATITFAGSVEGETRTIPLLVSLGLSSGEMDRALGACILLIGVYVLVVGMIVAVRILPGVRR